MGVQITYDTKGFAETTIALRTIKGRIDRELKRIAEEAGEIAVADMRINVPRSDKPSGRTISESLDVSNATYHPGGAGGGGTWVVHAGPINHPPEQLGFTWRGTGLFGEAGRKITPIHKSALEIGAGSRIARASAKGQEAQREWFFEANRLAVAHVAREVHRIRIRD